MVLDETDCMVEAARRLVEFYAHESCGKCTPCREGTWWATRVLGRIEAGYGRDGGPAADGRRGREHPVPGVLRARRRRGLADPVDAQHFIDEYEAHIRDGRCPVTGVGPRPRCREPEPEAVTFTTTGPFEIQGARS